ncbi:MULTISPECIES: truncated hemoglobin [unclassified Halomonas]|uniref:truncated hemoglobin n=1 Tax=unclassified Halomonas TaxID=2609666 RepID=UPI0006DA199B|nr:MULTISPECIES: group 1 truncated hemoglobin [unclassified Halomonas]KPQ21722.1 MAG: hemoglobin [Halomonas sp. HL-93]SBR49295.1 hemoglobin [Halomonas sp. HL-93]SNY95878.1 hemoglobin [Halomonas sp. hl-4]
MSDTLFDRLGGLNGIDKLVNRIVELHLESDIVGPRYWVLDEEAIDHAREKVKEFIAAGTGGPVEYTGRSMIETHTGMNVSAAEYLAVIDDIMQAMNEMEYSGPVCNEVLGIAYSLKEEIVHI